MQPKTQKLLEDIRDAASFIVERTRGGTFDIYVGDRLLRQAIERNFEIIGEATNRLLKIDAETVSHVSNANRIVAFWNVLIHGYEQIDDREVWRVITESVPILVKEVEALLTAPDRDTPK
jgi:uncharacterized protein with HEPN domain